ncbi:MAG: VanZ family protein [Clostridia bacterium]|nr:VanZ family protein [Clostridia bacterium]
MKRALNIAAAVWLAVLLRLTVFRDGCFSHGLFSGQFEPDAFAFYLKLLRAGKWDYFLYLFGGNIIWFLPAGFMVRLWGGRLPQALLAGFLLSLVIETAQFVLGCGVSELDDLILNTLGAAIGYGVGCLTLKKLSPREKKE